MSPPTLHSMNTIHKLLCSSYPIESTDTLVWRKLTSPLIFKSLVYIKCDYNPTPPPRSDSYPNITTVPMGKILHSPFTPLRCLYKKHRTLGTSHQQRSKPYGCETNIIQTLPLISNTTVSDKTKIVSVNWAPYHEDLRNWGIAPCTLNLSTI